MKIEFVILSFLISMHLQGTKVQILKPRKLDDSTAGFEKWKFMSVASWGEDPRGSWTLDILDEVIHSRINFPNLISCAVCFARE